MRSQHTTISVPAAVLLGVAATSAVSLGIIITIQGIVTVRVYEGTTALLASLVAMTGTGFIVCQTVDRVMRRLDEMERRMDGMPVDDEAVDAARRINLRLLNSHN